MRSAIDRGQLADVGFTVLSKAGTDSLAVQLEIRWQALDLEPDDVLDGKEGREIEAKVVQGNSLQGLHEADCEVLRLSDCGAILRRHQRASFGASAALSLAPSSISWTPVELSCCRQ